MSNLLAAALWYAKHGFYIFPCWPGTKKPATPNGLDDATTDLAQVRRWWQANPTYNVAINCGLSGLLVVDRDLYKTKEAHTTIAAGKTVTVNTARGGIHDWYRMPVGKRYGNSRGSLPTWLDIRGFGGYVMAPPSVFVEEGQRLPYTFADGCKPTEMAIADLPADIAIVLDAAHTKAAASVHFAEGNIAQPDLASWDLSADIMDLIANGAPKGERSEADYRVILALARAGASDDEIRAVFVYFAIGEKFREKAASGNKYLGLSIGKARTWLEDHPPDPKASTEKLAAARQWVRSPACLDYLRAHGVRRVADLVPILDALLEMAQRRRTTRVVTGVRAVADACALAKSSAHRRLLKVADTGLLTLQPDQYGTLIDLSPLLDLSGTLSTIDSNVGSVPFGSTSEDDFIACHRGDDAFTSYPYSYAIKRRQAASVLMQSLGASGLLLWNALLDGGTVKELAEVTGMTVASVRATSKKFDQAGLLVIWEEGRSKWYELHPDAWDRLEERREHMVTAGIGQLRAARNASDLATYAQHKLQGRMPLEPREKMKLENRRGRADEKVAAYYAALLGMGIDPRAKVRQRPPRHRIRIDHGEEWVSIYRPIYEQWQELSPLTFVERYRMLGMAGYEQREIDDARRMGGKMGRGPRIFVGVGRSQSGPEGHPAQAVAHDGHGQSLWHRHS